MEVDITIEKHKKKRSKPQNAYLHTILIPSFREALYQAGYSEVVTDIIAKEIMKGMFLKRTTVNEETGEILEYIKDTSALDTLEMSTLYEDVWRFCAESLNYFIPSPGQQSQLYASK